MIYYYFDILLYYIYFTLNFRVINRKVNNFKKSIKEKKYNIIKLHYSDISVLCFNLRSKISLAAISG